jgi:hypothetical protein
MSSFRFYRRVHIFPGLIVGPSYQLLTFITGPIHLDKGLFPPGMTTGTH